MAGAEVVKMSSQLEGCLSHKSAKLIFHCATRWSEPALEHRLLKPFKQCQLGTKLMMCKARSILKSPFCENNQERRTKNSGSRHRGRVRHSGKVRQSGLHHYYHLSLQATPIFLSVFVSIFAWPQCFLQRCQPMIRCPSRRKIELKIQQCFHDQTR